MSEIEACYDVRGFFIEEVTAAMDALQVRAGDQTKGYLVDLLSGFTDSERVGALSMPLVEQLQAALAVRGPERTARMRVLGDIALFLSGFFPDSFDRRGLSEAYVVSMGGRAYLMVARATGRAHGELFVELADRFRELARVLDEVRERSAMCTDGAILRLYERFCESGSPTLARRLQRRGVVPHVPRRGMPN